MTESTVKEGPQRTAKPTKWLEFAAAILLIGITLVVTLQIVCRYILEELPPWSEELSRYLFIWANFVGAGVHQVTPNGPGLRGIPARPSDAPVTGVHLNATA